MQTVAASLPALRKIVCDRQAARFRWPGETGRGALVDHFTASRVIAAHDGAEKTETKEKVARMVAASRASFLRVVTAVMR